MATENPTSACRTSWRGGVPQFIILRMNTALIISEVYKQFSPTTEKEIYFRRLWLQNSNQRKVVIFHTSKFCLNLNVDSIRIIFVTLKMSSVLFSNSYILIYLGYNEISENDFNLFTQLVYQMMTFQRQINWSFALKKALFEIFQNF